MLIPVTFVVPESAIIGLLGLPIAKQIASAVRVRALKDKKSKKIVRVIKVAPTKIPIQSTVRPHFFGGKTPSQLALISTIPNPKRGYIAGPAEHGQLTASQLIRPRVGKRQNYSTADKNRLTPSALYLAHKRRVSDLRARLYNGPTASQLLVKYERSNRSVAQETNEVYPTVSQLGLSRRRSSVKKTNKPAPLAPTPSLLLLKHLGQIPNTQKPKRSQKQQLYDLRGLTSSQLLLKSEPAKKPKYTREESEWSQLLPLLYGI